MFLDGAPVVMKSGQQKGTTLSMAKAELTAATTRAQNMRYVMRVLESFRSNIELPMILEADNKSVIDLWSGGGQIRHIEVRQYFLRELKEKVIISVKLSDKSQIKF